MSDFIDHLPGRERERIRKKMRSPEAYEALRDRVKGPEDLEKEMQRSEKIAELRFSIESEPEMKDRLKSQIEKDVRELGIDAVLESENIPVDIKKILEQGKFSVAVSSHPTTHDDALAVMPEGNIQENIPVRITFAETYAAQFISGANATSQERSNGE